MVSKLSKFNLVIFDIFMQKETFSREKMFGSTVAAVNNFHCKEIKIVATIKSEMLNTEKMQNSEQQKTNK